MLCLLPLLLAFSSVRADLFDVFGWKWMSSPKPLPFREIVCFGDSISDSEGVWDASNQTWPAHPAYWLGRFSDGPTWIEHVSKELDIPLRNYAFGGATSDNDLVEGHTGLNGSIKSPAVVDQVINYIDAEHHADTIHFSLFVFCVGSNDIFFNNNVQAAQVAEKIKVSIDRLTANGAWAFALVVEPALDMAPYYDLAHIPDQDRKVVTEFSSLLRYNLRALAILLQDKGHRLHVAFVDFYTQWNLMLANPTRYGFGETQSRQPCLQGIYTDLPVTECYDKEKRLYFDEFHPSARSHLILAEDALKAIRDRFKH